MNKCVLDFQDWGLLWFLRISAWCLNPVVIPIPIFWCWPLVQQNATIMCCQLFVIFISPQKVFWNFLSFAHKSVNLVCMVFPFSASIPDFLNTNIHDNPAIIPLWTLFFACMHYRLSGVSEPTCPPLFHSLTIMETWALFSYALQHGVVLASSIFCCHRFRLMFLGAKLIFFVLATHLHAHPLCCSVRVETLDDFRKLFFCQSLLHHIWITFLMMLIS